MLAKQEDGQREQKCQNSGAARATSPMEIRWCSSVKRSLSCLGWTHPSFTRQNTYPGVQVLAACNVVKQYVWNSNCLTQSISTSLAGSLSLSLSISLFICLSNLVLSNLIYSALLQTNLIHILLYISTYNPSIHPSIHPSVRPSIHNFMIT